MEEHRGEQKHPATEECCCFVHHFHCSGDKESNSCDKRQNRDDSGSPSDTYSLVHSLQFSCEKTSL